MVRRKARPVPRRFERVILIECKNGLYTDVIGSNGIGALLVIMLKGNVHFFLFPITKSHNAERQDMATTPAYCNVSFMIVSLFIVHDRRNRCKNNKFSLKINSL